MMNTSLNQLTVIPAQALIVTHKANWMIIAKAIISTLCTVIPAEAGIQWHLGAFNLNLNPKSSIFRDRKRIRALGSRLRGNDELTGWCSYLRLQWSKNLWVTISAYAGMTVLRVEILSSA